MFISFYIFLPPSLPPSPSPLTSSLPPPACINGMVHSTCGTGCPVTCDNMDQDIICLQQCVDGCFCPPGMVINGNTCVQPEECTNSSCKLTSQDNHTHVLIYFLQLALLMALNILMVTAFPQLMAAMSGKCVHVHVHVGGLSVGVAILCVLYSTCDDGKISCT